MSEEQTKKKTGQIATAVAEAEYDRWCKKWHIGRKMRRATGEALEDLEIQKDTIVSLIEDGLLSMDEKGTLHYTLEEPCEGLPEKMEIPRPKGDLLMESDRFKEQENMKRAYAMVAAATGYDSKTLIRYMQYNTDVSNLMAVIGHFLTA